MEDLYHRAIRGLGRSELAGGVALLEEATLRSPGNAAAWNDLAVGRLERAVKERRAMELVGALAALGRALSIDPALPEAHFNLALILDRLHLRGRSREAWEGYLKLDPSSAWADEARGHLHASEAPSLAELWEDERPRLEKAAARGDIGTVRGIVRRFPHRARVSLEEEALGFWGAALEDGDSEEAASQLELLRVLASALEQTTGDAMARDTVKVIDRAVRERPPEELERLAAGHAAFGKGLALYRDQEGEAALPFLADAARQLRKAASPFAHWADFYATVCTHYADSNAALAAFRDLAAATDTSRYPVLAGFQLWMVGTVASYLNRPEDALGMYAEARDRLASAGAPPETHGFVHVLVADAYEVLGEPDEAWRERLAGLRAAAAGGDRRRLHATLVEAAGATAHLAPEAALELVLELLESDRVWGNEGALVEAYSLAGRTYADLGRYEEAREAFGAARRHAAAVGEGDQTEHIAMEAALAEGEALIEADPREAVERLGKALESARRRSFQGFDDRMLLARARAWRALGDLESAEEDLLAALAVYEGVRERLESEPLRLSYFEGAQEAIDGLVRLQAVDRRSPEAALAIAERGRARLLLDMVETEPGSVDLPQPLDVTEIAHQLPAGVALVEFAVLPDRLLAWRIYGGGVKMIDLAHGAQALARKVSALRSTIDRRPGEPEFRRPAAELYDDLLRPIVEGLPDQTPLVVVPDRFLAQVPFPALFDRRRGRYVIEDRTVAVAPSATLYVTALKRMRGFLGPRTVLAVGDPAFDRAAHPTLPRLPGAADEAAEVAGLFAGSDLLRYEAATPEAVLEAASAHRVLHVSGHALLDPRTPWNHRLVLAPGAEGSSLEAREIAALRLPETEIVVLSACRTLPGGTKRESFHGLAAAFFAAGPPVVVSSLWEIEDRATRALMVRFHEALRGGAAPADALREAQLHLLRQEDPALASPAAWGGFEAFGAAILD